MNVLAIDTATENLGIALEAGDRRLALTARMGPGHGENLVPCLEFLFKQLGVDPPNLDLVVCCLGPGSFTGLRIGLATAKGIAAGGGCALVGVSGLDAVAYRFRAFNGPVLPVIDARKHRFYCAAYENGERRGDYLDIRPRELASLINDLPGVLLTGPHAGAALEKIREAGLRLETAPTLIETPAETEALLELGKIRFKENGADPPAIAPLYIRPSEAELAAGEDKET
jgi:tRNA threonylcarbamoyladenosine biosynthesis protein TsaB